MKKLLITGITGLLGSQIAIDLLKQGISVIGLYSDENPFSRLSLNKLRDQIIFPSANILKKEEIKRVIIEYAPDGIIHLAAQPIVCNADLNPFITFDTNVRSTYTILDSVRETDKSMPVIVASTDKVYGEGSPPFSEVSPLNAVYPYDVSKLCVDRIGYSYFLAFGLNVVMIRPSNIYGPGDIHRSRLVPDVILDLISGKAPKLRSDGNFIRDFIFVEDISRAVIDLLFAMKERKVSHNVYNIGSGVPYRVVDIVSKLINISGKKLVPEILGQNLREIKSQWLDISRFRKEFKLLSLTGIDEGLEITYKWYYDASKSNKTIFAIP